MYTLITCDVLHVYYDVAIVEDHQDLIIENKLCKHYMCVYYVFTICDLLLFSGNGY